MSSTYRVTTIAVLAVAYLFKLPINGQVSQSFTYYVDNAGNDESDGRSPSDAFRTIAKVNSLNLIPGQSVGFKCGGRWNEQLQITHSGVTYGSYGSGAQPIVSASNPLTSPWSQMNTDAAEETGGVFASGMEATKFSDWSSVVNQTAWMGTKAAQVNQVKSPVFHGSFAMQVTGNQGQIQDNRAGLQRVFGPMKAGSTLYFRSYMYVPGGSLKPNSQFIPMALFSNSQSAAWLTFATDRNGAINSARFDGIQGFGSNTVFGLTPIQFQMDNWNEVELAFKIGSTSSNGGVQLWINNTSVATNQMLNTSAAVTLNSIVLGNSYYGGALSANSSLYYDDFYIDTSFIGTYSATGPKNPIWSTSLTADPYFPSFNGLPGTPAESLGGLSGPSQWYWDGTTLYVYGVPNPGTSVELPVRNNAATLNNASNVTIQNLDFRGGLLECVFATGQVSNLKVSNSTFELAYRSGFSTIETIATISGFKIANNVFRYNGALGTNFNVNHQSSNYWGYNQVYSNAQISSTDPEHSFTGGMKWWGGTAAGDTTANLTFGQGTLVEFNVVYNNGVSTSVRGQGAGIWPDTLNGFEVRYNTVYGNKGDGIRLENTGQMIVHHNLLINNAAMLYTANIDVTAGSGQNSVANQVFNNTAQGGYWGIAHSAWEGNGFTSMSFNSFTNNIAVGAETYGNLYAANAGANDGVHGTGNVYSHNCFGAETPSFLQYNGNAISSYAKLDQAYGSPTFSVKGDPAFVNLSSELFQLQSVSPCASAGTPVANYITALRPNIGAY